MERGSGETLGERLQRARQARSLTLADVEARTKIPRVHLAALERNDFYQIPGEVYVKGFLKSYARAVGLDSDEVLAAYAAWRTDSPSPVRRPGWKPVGSRRRARALRRLPSLGSPPRQRRLKPAVAVLFSIAAAAAMSVVAGHTIMKETKFGRWVTGMAPIAAGSAEEPAPLPIRLQREAEMTIEPRTETESEEGGARSIGPAVDDRVESGAAPEAAESTYTDVWAIEGTAGRLPPPNWDTVWQLSPAPHPALEHEEEEIQQGDD